jgi:hypothetical protein
MQEKKNAKNLFWNLGADSLDSGLIFGQLRK